MTELHRAIVEGVECVLVPINENTQDFDYPCRDLKCPRCDHIKCTIDTPFGDDEHRLRLARGCYEPYSGFWSPVTHYLTLRLTGQLEAPQLDDL